LNVPKVTFIALKKATILLSSFMISSWIVITFYDAFFVTYITKQSLRCILQTINKNEMFIINFLNHLFSFVISETKP